MFVAKRGFRNFSGFFECIGDGSELYVKSQRNEFDKFVEDLMKGKGSYYCISQKKSYFLKFEDKYQASDMLDLLRTDGSVTVRFASKRLREY